jgi:hypothetical protein
MKPLYESAAPRVEQPSPEQVKDQLDRIVRSRAFRNAPSLQRLLQYVTSKSTTGQPGQLKEYTIGADVFGRGTDYDPKVNPVVRVEMHRVRQKLREYYKAEGADDPIFLEIPRGHYLPTFDIRIPFAPKAKSALQATDSSFQVPESCESQDGKEAAGSQASTGLRILFFSHPVVALCLAAILILSAAVIGAHWPRTGANNKNASLFSADSAASRPGDVVHDFWASFLGKDRTPIVGYANAVLLIDHTNDLFRFRRGASDNRGAPVDPHVARQFASNPSLAAKAGPLFYDYGYTGTGDVEGVWRLTGLFSQLGYALTLKRSRLVTIQDLQEHNVILLGSSFQNDAVAQLPSTGHDFLYELPGVNDELWNGRIVCLHPLSGEALSYKTERDKVTQIVKADYALITVRPGIAPGRYIAIVGGLDTSGGTGAVEFLTSASGLAELATQLASLGEKKSEGRPPFFQAVIKVDVENGLDVLGFHLVSVHAIHLDGIRASGARPEPQTSGNQ